MQAPHNQALVVTLVDSALFLCIGIHDNLCKYLIDRNLPGGPWMPLR